MPPAAPAAPAAERALPRRGAGLYCAHTANRFLSMRVAPDRFLEIFDSLDYLVAIYDREWQYTYVNAEAARVLGRPVEALLGRSVWELFPEAVDTQHHRELHEAVATGRPIHGDRYDAPLGRWFEDHIYPLAEGGALVLSRDVTPERAAARAGGEREQMLRLAQRAGGVATFVWDFANQIAQCSAEFFRIFGLPEQDGVMTPSEWTAFVHPDDRERLAAHLARALRGEEPAAADYRIVRPDGRVRWISYAGQLQRTDQGERMLGTVADITARKDTEDALRRSEERLQLALDAAQMVAWDWDRASGRTTLSPSGASVLGFTDQGWMDDEHGLSRLPAEDRERHWALVQRAIAAGEPWVSEVRFTRPTDGRTLWLEDRGRVVRGADGEVESASGVLIDVTARAEAQLRASRHAEDIEHILQSIGEGFVAVDREFRYVYVNAVAERMLERSRDELLGRRPWDVFADDVTADARRELEAVMAAGTPRRSEVYVPGWNRWFENRVYPSSTGLSIFFADVTARVEAEAALRHSRDVLSLAMRGGAMGAWSRDLATNEVWWSPELEEIVGLAPGSFSGTEDAFFEMVHDEDRDAVSRAVGDAVVNRTDYIVDFRFRHASGEWRWMEGRGRATYAADGSPRSVYGIGVDVTARKRAEAALEAARDAAEAANRLKDQFLANLSHELRTPLNAILGYARLLQTGIIGPDKWRQAIAVIERNAVAQNQLVEDLLDMSRITTGTVHLDPAPVPIASVIRQAVDAVRPAAEGKKLALVLELDPFAGMVSADATRLQQVFWNLLNNAVKFTPPGGRIAVRLERAGAAVEAAISDTGIGIPAAFLPFVFEPFRQADARLGRRFGGLGLGLAICRQLVELHGGSIEVTSAGDGQGATFTVRLPACDTAGAPAPDTPRSAATDTAIATAAGRLAGVTVLLVEDDADTLALFTTALEAEGARVRTAGTPADALALVGHWRPDLLVSDIGLPGMDGYELLHAIRSRVDGHALATVAVSAYARPDDRARALAAGFHAHVTKPVDPSDLVKTLAATLDAV